MIKIFNKFKTTFTFIPAITFIIGFCLSISLSSSVLAANETIEMLNKLGKETMVFSKKIVNVDVGDTVYWKATKAGHNVEFI